MENGEQRRDSGGSPATSTTPGATTGGPKSPPSRVTQEPTPGLLHPPCQAEHDPPRTDRRAEFERRVPCPKPPRRPGPTPGRTPHRDRARPSRRGRLATGPFDGREGRHARQPSLASLELACSRPSENAHRTAATCGSGTATIARGQSGPAGGLVDELGGFQSIDRPASPACTTSAPRLAACDSRPPTRAPSTSCAGDQRGGGALMPRMLHRATRTRRKLRPHRARLKPCREHRLMGAGDAPCALESTSCAASLTSSSCTTRDGAWRRRPSRGTPTLRVRGLEARPVCRRKRRAPTASCSTQAKGAALVITAGYRPSAAALHPVDYGGARSAHHRRRPDHRDSRATHPDHLGSPRRHGIHRRLAVAVSGSAGMHIFISHSDSSFTTPSPSSARSAPPSG